MEISKKIKLGNTAYYITIDLEYKKNQIGIPTLYLKNYKNNYWDEGDCSKLIEKIEKSYTIEKAIVYDKNILFMGDILYIYNRIPFISGIKDVYVSKQDNLPYSIGYITKEEIENYIKEFNIKMESNINFKLFDEHTWEI